ncbi:MAG: TatD family hydrolase [Sulfuricurvum sp.]|uniref:TatD family hydrolase n=1 Tax=Sulfuricurvum sp. TaxID=2025608 RepID=UPI0026064821|nr:TatD family hydrolase [Sulfuricurvum sp.]MDD5160048.1 TatD family hydrolase [Sulfuricurvum sp.]
MIIDTHVHLDDERYRDDFDAMITRAHEAGVESFIIPGAHPATLQRAVEICEQYSDVYFAVGVHPYDMEHMEAVDFEAYAAHPKCVAIGECGLDYFRLEGSDAEKHIEKMRQDEVFRSHIRFAKKVKKPLIVHIRDASHDAKMILLEEDAGEIGGVLHCYNADDELLSLANENFYFGIGGVVTFQNAKKLVNILHRIPQDKLLIETDGPYLTPHPHRGSRNESAYTRFIADKMAELLTLTTEEIEAITTCNAKKLFGFG